MDDTREFILYRAWDGDVLLYVGITINPGARFYDHSSQSIWWDRATYLRFERLTGCTDRASALKIEAQRIRAERPVFNMVSAPHNRGKRFTRDRDYAPNSPSMVALRDLLPARIAARAEVERLDARQSELVKEILAEGCRVVDLAVVLGVTKARVYQIRDGRR